MVPSWSVTERQRLTNAVFAHFRIPVEVTPCLADYVDSSWHVDVFGGTLSIALERMHAKQDVIIERIAKSGMSSVSRQDALFMYASQWFEWTILREGPRDTDHAEMVELMEGWATLYETLGDRFVN